MATAIINCDCKHEFQDAAYGKQKRVHNHAPSKGGKPNRYKCTICGKEHEFSNRITTIKTKNANT